MSASDQLATSTRAAKLGIIHLLGWMAGVAVVLGLYRAALESGWLGVSTAGREEARWWQTAYGLVYGTAVGGAGLLLYRRWRGQTDFPAQPGHWLLVFGALAFAADALSFVLAKGITVGIRATAWQPGLYYLQQWLAWGLALAVALVVVTRLRTQWNWRLLAALIAALIGVNFVTHSLVLAESVAQALGYWTFASNLTVYLVHWGRIVGTGICLAALPLVLAGDRGNRDWLHWVGIAALIALAIVEEADQIQTIVRAR